MFGKNEEMMMPLALLVVGLLVSGCIPFVPFVELETPVVVAMGGGR
jgi:hypothetical protein